MHVFARSVSHKPGLSITPGGTLWTIFQNQMQRKIAARLVELPLAQTATCSHLLRQPLAATCSHLQPLASTCSHLPKQPLGRHLQPLAATWQTLDKAATWQPLAATCSHLQPLGSHVLKQPLGSHLAATCSHSQTLAPSGCSKWLQQVAAKWLLEQVAAKWLFFLIKLRTSCAHNADLSTLSTF